VVPLGEETLRTRPDNSTWYAEEVSQEYREGRLARSERADDGEGSLVAAWREAGHNPAGGLAHQRRHLVAVEPVAQIVDGNRAGYGWRG
jgi:hypothetical protein